MNQAQTDLTLEEVLNDPLIRAVRRADGVTSSEFRTLLTSAASALRHVEPEGATARKHASNLLAAPKRRLLAMVHPLAVHSSGQSSPCY